MDGMEKGHVVGVKLDGPDSRVQIDGMELRQLLDVLVHQPMDGGPIVTIQLRAESVTGLEGQD